MIGATRAKAIAERLQAIADQRAQVWDFGPARDEQADLIAELAKIIAGLVSE